MENERPRVTIHMAASLDGFIARRDGRVDWLETSDSFENGATLTPETVDAFLSQRRRDGQLHVWLLSTQMTAEERAGHWSGLSPDERDRAGRFRFDADANRYIVARGGLRVILSAYTGVPPAELVFQVGSHGKPSLSTDPAIEFNVSHSAGFVLIGVTQGIPCGVDIERARAGRHEAAIADGFFSPREIRWLANTAGGFFRLWTAKEAVIKAVGRGLSIPLSDVDVTDVVAGRATSIVLDTPGVEPRTIALAELPIGEDYAAAVAVDGVSIGHAGTREGQRPVRTDGARPRLAALDGVGSRL
jgi:4'-phosphopantetheinyl transferase